MLRLLLLLLSGCGLATVNAAPVIGFVYANGTYHIDGIVVRGNATIFDGAIIETDDAPAKLQLDAGSRVWLTAGSKTKVSSQGVVLLSGLSQLQGTGGFALKAGPIEVQGSGPDSIVRVKLDSSGAAVVMPVQGAADVRNTRGVAVGNIGAGQTVQFAAYPGAATAIQSSGCLRRRGDEFTITDQVTNVTLQLAGRPLENEVGQTVHVTGVQESGSGADSRRRVRVTAVENLGTGACAAPARAPILLASAAPAQAPQAPTAKPAALNIVIVEGEGAINNIRQRTAREPIVEVQDENHRPVAGALVLFALPHSGPGGTFANGATTLSVTTDQQGRAVAHGLKPNKHAGQFQVTVTASYAGATATAAITQINVLAAVAAAGAGAGAGVATGLALGAKVAIIGGVAATATVGGLAASGAIFGGGSAEPPASR